MKNYLCTTCGTQYAATAAEPTHCVICEDDRQYVNWQGQTWTTLEELQANHQNIITPVESNLYKIETSPKFAIGQKAFLVQSAGGNILWDCLSLVDEKTIQEVKKLGGIKAIALSHPHYYSAQVEWSQAFGNVPIYIHAADQQWVMRPDPAIHFWEGTTLDLGEGIKIINCGGHFPGACVLHWPAGAHNQGVVLSGDTIQVAMNRKSVSFMYSYPNMIPLKQHEIQTIRKTMAPYVFERMYGAFDPYIGQQARAAFDQSVDRYLQIYV